MKQSLYDRLACPMCLGELLLKVEEGDLVNSVVTGSLACKECKRVYPIVQRIPRLLPNKFVGQKHLNTEKEIKKGDKVDCD